MPGTDLPRFRFTCLHQETSRKNNGRTAPSPRPSNDGTCGLPLRRGTPHLADMSFALRDLRHVAFLAFVLCVLCGPDLSGNSDMVTKVRAADTSDVSQLAELADKLIPDEAPTCDRIRVLTRSLRRPDYFLFVAEEERRLLGFADLWVFPDFAHGKKMGIIQNLFVDRTFRRRGIGDLLMRCVIRRASELKLKELHVWTTFRNRAAISLYRKHGLTRKSLLLEREFER
jgi:ribosomal protein S18 acetylase RimI-like enzyme